MDKLIEIIYKVIFFYLIYKNFITHVHVACDVLFILDIVDILKNKVPNDVKTIYISN
jgi:hypothetical protein